MFIVLLARDLGLPAGVIGLVFSVGDLPGAVLARRIAAGSVRSE